METIWYLWLSSHTWAVEIITVLLLLLVANYAIKKLLTHAQKKSKIKEDDWRLKLDYAALVPMRVGLWVLLIFFLMDLLFRESHLKGVFIYIGTLRNVLLVLCLSWFLLRWKKVFSDSLVARRDGTKMNFDPASLEVAGKVFTVCVVFVTTLVILQLLGLNVLPLITFGGIGAAALGIAGKDVIANFFGGFMMYLTRPFTIGDFIELPQKQIAGQIERIGWYFTSIRDIHRKPIYIPNAIFSTELLINSSRITHRRIEEVIRISYRDIAKVPSIVGSIRTLFQNHPEIDRKQPLNVFFKNFGTYSVEIEVQAYTLTTRYDYFTKIKEEIFLKIYDVVKSAGAEMPYPVMSVELKNFNSPAEQ